MKLSNAILRPGKVLEVVDANGTIKVSAPGLFSDQDDPQLLPPVTPLLLFHSNQYSTPLVDDEVWVLNFTDNTQQLYWFRKDNYIENNKDIQEEVNVEVLCSRESGAGWATIYFSDDSGWYIKNDKTFIQLDPDGNIKLKNPNAHRCIEINSNNISIGSEGESAHPACFGDITADLLWKIYMTFNALKTASAANPMTAHLGAAINMVGDWSGDISKIKSGHVTID
jgi:hypothetical protein